MASSSRQRSGSSDSKPFPQARSGRSVQASQARKPQGIAASGMSAYEGQTLGSLRQERERRERAARRQERMRQERRKSNLPFIIVGVVLFLALSFTGLYFILINTNVFEIEDIEFRGTDHLTSQEVSALVSVPQGTTLLNIDSKSIEDSLKRDAWVKDVSVSREFPNKLVINVEERSIGAVAEIPMGINQIIQDWAISDDGMWLMAIPSRESEIGSQLSEAIYEDAASALHIDGVPYGVTPEIGAHCDDDNINNALKIISDMTTELADQLKSVTATDAESTLLTLDSNIEIAFGDSSNIREKERICLKIMEENPTVVYINVRVPDRPTWRSA